MEVQRENVMKAWTEKDEAQPPSLLRPGSTLRVTRLVLTFGIHQVHHNILLALVKRELAWEVEAFFALYFDRLLVNEWMKNEGGGREGTGTMKGQKNKKQNGFQWGQWTLMQNNDVKSRWSLIKPYISNNENEKQVMMDGWKFNENYAGHNSVSCVIGLRLLR